MTAAALGYITSPARRHPGWLRAGISAGLLALLLALVDLEAAWGILAAADPGLLGLMLGLMLGERLFAAWRWLVLLRVAGSRVRFWPVLRLTFISNFLGIFLPGGVGIEVLRVWGLSRLLADLPLALSSVVVERLCGLMAMILIITVGLLLAPIELPYAVEMVAGGALIALLAGIAAFVHPWSRRLAWRGLVAVPSRLRNPLVGLAQRLDGYRCRPGALAWSLALAAAFQALRVTTLVIGALALGIEVDPVLLMVVVPVGTLVTQVPISIGGFGPREASYVVLLGLAGIAPEAALVLALTREGLNLLTTLPGAVMYARTSIAGRR